MNLVINSQFRPFTYDEMVKPLAQYKEVYDKIEQDYSDLTTQTEMWKDIVNKTNSPEAYEMYQRYTNDLTAVTEDFSRGMNINNRRALLGMKRRYAQDITPIASADAAMKAANELRVKAGPDAIFEVGEYNSLDQFLHGKTANNNYISKEALIKKTAAMTEAAMAEALRDPEFQKEMGDQFWLITQHTGGSYEDLMAAISNSPQAQSRFAQIKQRVMADADIDKYDARGRMSIEDAVNTGLYAGLDKPVRSFQANADHITPAQSFSMALQSAEMGIKKEQHEWAKAARNPLSIGNNQYLDPVVGLTFSVDDKGNRTYSLKSDKKTKTSGSGSARINRDNRIVRIRTSGKKAGMTLGQLKTIPRGAVLTDYTHLTTEQKKQADIYRQNDSETAYTWYVDGDDLIAASRTSVVVGGADSSTETDSKEDGDEEISEGL